VQSVLRPAPRRGQLAQQVSGVVAIRRRSPTPEAPTRTSVQSLAAAKPRSVSVEPLAPVPATRAQAPGSLRVPPGSVVAAKQRSASAEPHTSTTVGTPVGTPLNQFREVRAPLLARRAPAPSSPVPAARALAQPAVPRIGGVAAGARMPVGCLLLRWARDLIAKRAVEAHLRQRSKSRSSFCRLPCCRESAELQQKIAAAEKQIACGNFELASVEWARSQEVQQLRDEVEVLRQQVEDLRQEVEDPARSGECPGLPARRGLERSVEALRAQIAGQAAATQTARERAEEAEHAAAVQEARLEDICAAHAREVAALREQLLHPPEEVAELRDPLPQPPKEVVRTPDELADDRELLRCFAGLRGPASAFLRRHGYEPPETPRCAVEPDAAAAWMEALAASMESLAQDLEEARSQPPPAGWEVMAAAG